MPIRPENKARYPKDWKAISLAIRHDAQQRCECTGECGVNHFEEMELQNGVGSASHLCMAVNYQPHPVTGSKVILTVAHLDHKPENCDRANLKAMCQRCHNRYDQPMRRAGMKARAAEALAKTQPDMFAYVPTALIEPYQKPLFIPLNAEHYDKFVANQKDTEYRAFGPRWNFTTCTPGRAVILSRGYGVKNRMRAVIHASLITEPTAAFLAIYGPDKQCLAIRLRDMETIERK